MKITKNNRRYYTTGQVAEICGVATRTVVKWCDTNLLRHFRIPGSRDRRVLVDDLAVFLKEYITDSRIASSILGQSQILLFSNNPAILSTVEEVAALTSREVVQVTDFFALGEAVQQSLPGRWVAVLDTALGTSGVQAVLERIASQGRVLVLTTEDAPDARPWYRAGAVQALTPSTCDGRELRRVVADLCGE